MARKKGGFGSPTDFRATGRLGADIGRGFASFPVGGPEIGLMWVSAVSVKYIGFLSDVLMWSAPLTILIAVPVLRSRVLRPYLIGISGLVLLLTTVAIGEFFSKRQMCQTAHRFDVDVIYRHPFWWSLANTPREFQFQIHGILDASDGSYGWSYRAQSWYVIPEDARGNVTTGAAHLCT
ncbi:MAG: hypothetical protein AAFQ58_14305 [Pseudomonadota bacterium]